MAYNIQYKSSITKDIKRISKQEAVKLINRIETQLSQNPYSFPILKGEFKGLRKYRSGNFRIIFTIEKDCVIILKIGHRKDVYK